MIVPGIVGAIAVLLALYAFSVLPVSFVGVALLVAAFALFIAEAFVTSFGTLAIGGLVCFVLGSLMLFDTREQALRLSPALVVPVALVISATVVVLVSRVLKARRAPSPSGVEALIGSEGEVVAPLSPSGVIVIRGEYWDAVAPTPVSRGARVRVVGGAGRRLSVESLGVGAGKEGRT
jgi:membrane-bound serine protease (ClpP class)